MAKLMRVLKLEDKTRICRLPADTFDFLGYTFGRCYSKRRARFTWDAAVIGKISHLTNRQSYLRDSREGGGTQRADAWLGQIFALVRSAQPIGLLTPTPVIGYAGGYARNIRNKVVVSVHTRTSIYIGPSVYSNWAQPRRTSRGRMHEITLVRKPDAGNPHVRFDERGCGNGSLKGYRATPRLYRIVPAKLLRRKGSGLDFDMRTCQKSRR